MHSDFSLARLYLVFARSLTGHLQMKSTKFRTLALLCTNSHRILKQLKLKFIKQLGLAVMICFSKFWSDWVFRSTRSPATGGAASVANPDGPDTRQEVPIGMIESQ